MSEAKNRSVRIDRVLRMFSKSGGNGEFTKPFFELSKSIQDELSSRFELGEAETPILASYRDPNSWVVLTSERLASQNGEIRNVLRWEQIINATIPMSAIAALKSSVKLHNAVLEVATDAGKVEILIEAGKPFSGFWNVLKMIPQLA